MQFALTILFAGLFTFTIAQIGYRGGLNIVGFLFPPAAIAFIFNKAWPYRLISFTILLVIYLIFSIFIGAYVI